MTGSPGWRRFGVSILAAACALAVGSAAHAAIINFAASVDGAQETPPTATGAMATGTFVMDTDANTLNYNIVITVPPPSGEIAAHIHGFSGPGVPAGIVHGLGVGSPKIGVWNFSEAQQPSIIAELTYVNIHSNAFVGGEIRGQVLRVPSCGDGIVDGGEDCDDGNNVNGDCCSSACTFELAASPCVGATICASSGACDGAGSCQAAPHTGCKTALKSIILLKDDTSDDTKDKLIWKWIKGAMTTQTEMGDPTDATDYALCVFNGTANVLAAEVPADAILWSAISDKGYKYKDSTGASDGITKVLLKGGDAGKSKALVKGKGTGLPDTNLAVLATPVTAQLVNSTNSTCFEATYDAPDVIKNTAEMFKAKDQ